MASAHTVKISRGNGVEIGGDRADVIPGEHDQKEPRKLLSPHGTLAEDAVRLFYGGDQDLPQLAHLVGFRCPARIPEVSASCFQMLRQLHLLQEGGEGADAL